MRAARPFLRRAASILAAAALALALLLALSAARGGPSAPLTPRDRMEVFEKSWKEINDHYYDPQFHGVNWAAVHDKYVPIVGTVADDEQFYVVMGRMTAELHDAHTRFSSPQQWQNHEKQQGYATGVRIAAVEGQLAVTEVLPESSAARAGIEPGMIVTWVNGKPVQEKIAEAEKEVTPSSSERFTRLRVLATVFGGPPEAPLVLGLQRADGSQFEARLARQMISTAPHVTASHPYSDIAVVRFDQFRPWVAKELKQELEKDHGARGIVIDLRRNGGGEGSALEAMAGYFFPRKTLLAKIMRRKQIEKAERDGGGERQSDMYAGKDGGQIYAGSVVVLISESSGSAAELFAAGLQDEGRAKIVGSQSCGCVLGITKSRAMKGGGVLEISEVLWFSPKGRKLEGEGVMPDETVAPTISSLREKRDPVLDEGVKLVRDLAVREPSAAR